jgi:subtilase family serine protease
MQNKLRTALYGAAMAGCLIAATTSANAERVGNLTMVGTAQSGVQVHFDVMLPLRNVDGLEALVKAQSDPTSSQYHKWLTPAQFGAQFGPSKATLASVASYLTSRGFSVKKIDTRSIRVAGTTDQVSKNFGVHLVTARSDEGTTHIVTNDTFTLPSALVSAGAQIFSFSPHVAKVFSTKINVGHPLSGKTRNADNAGKAAQGYASNTANTSPLNRYSATGGYFFDDMKQAYTYPANNATWKVKGTPTAMNGTGATIAALMSSDVLDADIQNMFDFENWSTVTGTADPTLAGRFYVNGGAAFGGDASAEASLDTQMEIGGAPGAAVVLVDIPDLSDGNISAGYIDVDEYNFTDVVSSSFGECELFYTKRYNGGTDYTGVLKSEHELFLQGNSEGITFLASSGDSAGKICPNPDFTKYVAGVSTPASDPNVTAVGGTNLVTNFVEGSLTSSYAGENAWGDEWPGDFGLPGGWWGAGGGYSKLYSAPSYQSDVTTGSSGGRAVPDVGMQVGGCPGGATDYHPKPNVCNGNNRADDGAGNDQRSFVWVSIGATSDNPGNFEGLVGTSVSSPEFASVVALIVEKNGRMGNLNPYLYHLAKAQANGGATAFHTNIPGFNGLVQTDLNSTYSLSVGVGTPVVTTVIGKPTATPAGTPQTISNP